MNENHREIPLDERIFSRLLYVVTVLMWIAFGVSLLRYEVIGFQPIMVVHGVLVVLFTTVYALRERLTPSMAFHIAFLSALTLVLAGLLQFGLASATLLFFPLYPIIARVTRGRTAAYGYLAVVGGLFVLTAFLYCSSLIGPAVDLNLLVRSWQAWALTLTVALSLIIIFLYVYDPVEVILNEQKTWFTAVIDGVKDAVIILDAESGAIITCNGRTAEILRLEGNVVGHSFRELSPEESRGDIDELFAGVRAGDTPTFEWNMKGSDGRLVPFEISMRQTRIGSRDCIVAVLRDLTERHQAEKALREKELSYRRLFDNMTSALSYFEIILDENGVPCDARYLDVNPAFEQVTGWKAAHVLGKRLREVAPHTTERWIGICGKVALTGIPLAYQGYTEDLHKHLDIWVYPTEYGKYVVLFNDITDKKRSEQQLAEERERLSVTLRSIADGVITIDTEGRITLMNDVAGRLAGRAASETTGKPVAEFLKIVDEMTGEPVENPFVSVLKTGRIVELEGLARLIGRDGCERLISLSAAPLRNDQEQIIGVVLAFRDITEKRKIQETLQRAQRLESLGLLAGGIAHDFNNLLGGIYGAVELARLHLGDGRYSEAAVELSNCLETSKRAKALSHQLLTFSKGGAPIRKACRIEPLLRNCGRFALAGSAINCVFDIPDPLWNAEIDENQIGQVIENLVINAQQAMPDGGTITISAANARFQKGEHAMSPEGGRFVRIVVADNGPGIAREILPHIFDPFFTTKKKGHGLGLATSYSIVQRHGGHIDVESEAGVGARFTVCLPASQHQETIEEKPEKTGRLEIQGRLLFLDDEEVLHTIAKRMFSSYGFEFTGVRDGKEALALFEESVAKGSRFDLAVLDLTIVGGPGGREIIHDLRKISGDTIFVASSGYSVDPIMADPVAFGFDAGLPKPYSLDDIKALLLRFFPKKT